MENPWIVIGLSSGIVGKATAKVKAKNATFPITVAKSDLKQLYYLCLVRNNLVHSNGSATFAGHSICLTISELLIPRRLEMIANAYRYGLVLSEYDDSHYLTKVDNLTRFITPKESGVGIIGEVFRDQIYGKMAGDIRNKTIVDVGAFLGDTAVYFVRKGCKSVFAFEPNDDHFELARKNLNLNEVHNVELFKTSVGDNLKELIQKIGEVNVLKMDCEGCERVAIISTPSELLMQMEQIIMEYHGDPSEVVRKLKSSGFKVRVERPWTVMRGRPIGFLVAKH